MMPENRTLSDIDKNRINIKTTHKAELRYSVLVVPRIRWQTGQYYQPRFIFFFFVFSIFVDRLETLISLRMKLAYYNKGANSSSS